MEVRVKEKAQAPECDWPSWLYQCSTLSSSLYTHTDVLDQGESVAVFTFQWVVKRGIPCHPSVVKVAEIGSLGKPPTGLPHTRFRAQVGFKMGGNGSTFRLKSFLVSTEYFHSVFCSHLSAIKRYRLNAETMTEDDSGGKTRLKRTRTGCLKCRVRRRKCKWPASNLSAA